MDSYQFEFLASHLLKKLGYSNVRVTKRSGDKGIDVLADLTMEGITVVQVKRYKPGNNISGAVVAQLRGSCASGSAWADNYDIRFHKGCGSRGESRLVTSTTTM